jgi:hypothetical protein
MLNATPVAKRKPAIAKTDVPKAAVKLSNAHGNTPLNKKPMRSTASNNVTTSPNRLLPGYNRPSDDSRFINHLAKCRRHFIRVCPHVPLIQAAQPQLGNGARENQN